MEQAYQTAPENLPASRFKPGSCKYQVKAGDTLASIAGCVALSVPLSVSLPRCRFVALSLWLAVSVRSQYKLTWQEVFTLNAALVQPEDIKPGE
eukprot:3259755-Rhodomonas_salina.1